MIAHARTGISPPKCCMTRFKMHLGHVRIWPCCVSPSASRGYNWSVCHGRVMDVLSLEAAPTDASGDGQRLPSVRGDVEFRSVQFAYGGRRDAAVLRGLSLRVPAGSSVALVGASGSGKTTAVALLLRLYQPTAGAETIEREARGPAAS